MPRRVKTSNSQIQTGRSGGYIPTDADSGCSREPIQTPGAIQPHGVFLAADPARDLAVVAASRNAAELLGGFQSADRIIGRGVAALLGDAFADAVRQRLLDGKLRGEAPWRSTLRRAGRSAALDVSVHAITGLVHLELERADPRDVANALDSLRHLQDIIAELREARSELDALARVAVRGVRLLTGYERVLIYRFDGDWNGQAIAEDKQAGWSQSLQGLHFPASDIPSQARALYRHSPIRWVPDRDAAPVPLDTDPAWAADRPPHAIDLSFARLRSLSPVHLQFHRNMGVNGSMSLSILHEERLWGLMVCHHRQPHSPSPGQRAAAAALTDAFALRVGPAGRADTDRARRGDLARLSALLAQMAGAEVVTTALTAGEVNVGGLFDSTGAAVFHDETVSLLGRTPPKAELRLLANWLKTRRDGGMLFQTDNLAALYPPWERHAAIASGVLAVFLSPDRSDVLLWFRPEEPQLVSWGGRPQKGADGASALLPRLSFERWVETRHGFAKPWAEWELELAETLRHGITDVVIRGLRRIAELNDRLRQSQKMEAVGQLTGGLSHDFNNLLTGIIGGLELMRARVSQRRFDELDRYLDAAAISANRSAALIRRLLAFSLQQALESKAVDVNRLTISMEDLIRRTVSPAIHVETVMSGGLWKARCDANQLESALLNLAINARDAMPDGGRLTIEAANIHLDDAYARHHPEIVAGQYVVVSVTDTGTGMAPETVARVFEPFFTTKPRGQGSGLGLSMVYGFAKQSNGYVRIYSEPGQGTTVRLYVPRDLERRETAAGEPQPLPDLTAKFGETVLVVDDEPVVRMLIGDMLRDLGYGVVEAADGAEGLLVLQSKQRVDLLVSDIGLPGGMSGRQLADAARVHRPRLNVLFITGYAENAALGNGVLEPDMAVMTKPFAMDALAAKIHAMI